MSEIKISNLKLLNKEEVVGIITSYDKDFVIISNPLKIWVLGADEDGNMFYHLRPWFLGKTVGSKETIPICMIVAETEASENIAEEYTATINELLERDTIFEMTHGGNETLH